MMDKKHRVLTRFRRLCLTLPETTETNSWGHPNFRAGKRTFAVFEWIDGRPSVAFRLDTNDVDLYLLNHSDAFTTPYGRRKWISLWVDGRPDWILIKNLVDQSYRTVALKRMIAVLDGT